VVAVSLKKKRRKWKFLFATLVTIAAVGLILPAVVFGFKRSIAYWQSWEQIVARPALTTVKERMQSELNDQTLDPQKPRNQSLSAVLVRLTNNNSLARGMTAFIGLAMIWATWAVGRKAGEKSELLIGSAVITWMLLLPPVSWTHCFVILLLPLMVLVAVAITGPGAVTRRITGGALIVFGAVVLASAFVRQLAVMGAPCWATLMVWAALLFVVIRRERQPATGQTGY